MPWTFAHAAAVVPFRRWCPRHLSFFGLAIGSMTPDLGYYLSQYEIATFAHTLPGLAVCLPAGLLLILVIWYLRELLVVLLPQPHRHALQVAFAATAGDISWRRAVVLSVSVVLGAVTHIVWDSFTHGTGLPVAHSGLLRLEVLRISASSVPAYALFQHVSTVLGILVLAWVYRSWLRDCRSAGDSPSGGGDALRWWILVAIAAIGAAVFAAFVAFGIRGGEKHVSELVVQGVLFSTNIVVMTYLATALVFRRLALDGGNERGRR